MSDAQRPHVILEPMVQMNDRLVSGIAAAGGYVRNGEGFRRRRRSKSLHAGTRGVQSAGYGDFGFWPGWNGAPRGAGCGARMAIARCFWLSPRRMLASSLRISPGAAAPCMRAASRFAGRSGRASALNRSGPCRVTTRSSGLSREVAAAHGAASSVRTSR